MNKKAFEFSFGWLFALIVGAVILFLSIFFVTQYAQTQRTVEDTELGKELGIILNPVETGLETGKKTPITLPIETRIFNDCDSRTTFGSQKISTATRSSLGTEFQSPGLPSSFTNKYIFSEDVIQGKKFTAFPKPLNMPFKVADLIYLFPQDKEYCFMNPPNQIENEIILLQLDNIKIPEKIESCPKSSEIVCFTRSECNTDVTLLDSGNNIKGYVRKGFPRKSVYFDSSTFLYAAIFSSPELYECQLKRLMGRTSELSLLYLSKTAFLTPKGCSSNLDADLSSYAQKTLSFTSSSDDLASIILSSNNIGGRNDDLNCELF